MSNAETRDFKCKRSTISTLNCLKRVSGHDEQRHLPVRCNEFLICPPEKSKWKIGNLSQCLPCFITVACSRLHLGIHLPSFVFFFVMAKQSLLLAAAHPLSERVCHLELSTNPESFVCSLGSSSPESPVPCYNPAQPLFLSSLATVFIMHTLLLLESSFIMRLLGSSDWLLGPCLLPYEINKIAFHLNDSSRQNQPLLLYDVKK